MDKKTMSVPEVAKALGISRSLAYSLVSKGDIPSIRLGVKRLVVPVTAVEKMLADIESSYAAH